MATDRVGIVAGTSFLKRLKRQASQWQIVRSACPSTRHGLVVKTEKQL
jgi:hypothetical protein